VATQRISEITQKRLVRLAEQTGRTYQDLIDIAVSRLERELFLDRLNADFAALQSDEAAWAAELEERRAWDGTLSDGLP
jgi:hypothetical protein